jgi:hypothetical protein
MINMVNIRIDNIIISSIHENNMVHHGFHNYCFHNHDVMKFMNHSEPLFIFTVFQPANQPSHPGGDFSHVGLRTCEGHGTVRPHGVDAVAIADVLGFFRMQHVGNRWLMVKSGLNLFKMV